MKIILAKKELNVRKMRKNLLRKYPDRVEKIFDLKDSFVQENIEIWKTQFERIMAKKYDGLPHTIIFTSHGANSDFTTKARLSMECRLK